jgi:hypothetical protein
VPPDGTAVCPEGELFVPCPGTPGLPGLAEAPGEVAVGFPPLEEEGVFKPGELLSGTMVMLSSESYWTGGTLNKQFSFHRSYE